jgi:hypothetical protein
MGVGVRVGVDVDVEVGVGRGVGLTVTVAVAEGVGRATGAEHPPRRITSRPINQVVLILGPKDI